MGRDGRLLPCLLPASVAVAAPVACGVWVAVACLALAFACDTLVRLPFAERLGAAGRKIAALSAGKQASLDFTVGNPRARTRRGCRLRLILADLPWMYSQIRHFAEDLRERLVPGSRIVASGRGTWMGVVFEGVRVVGDER
ncbi:hypothetical protein [Stappia sp. ICDLI1TA098]